MTINVADLRTRAERAQSAFEEGRARLIRPDGTRLFSDEEHNEQMAALRHERNAVLEEVQEETRAILQGTHAQITHLENRDPQELLTPEELDRANARRPFAHWMAGERRRARILERRHENARRASDNPAEASLAQSQASTVTELDEILRRMREVLDEGRTEREIKAVRERAREASDVQGMAHLAQREQSSFYEPDYAIPGPGQYPYGR